MYKKIVYLIILIALISCSKSPKCNSTHTISGQVLNGSTLQPMANVQMSMECGDKFTNNWKGWTPITDKDGKYSITYNCSELSADSIRVGIIPPTNYCGCDSKRTQHGYLYHKANFDGVYNFYVANQGKVCIKIKEKTLGSFKKSLPQILRISPNEYSDYFIKLDSNSLTKSYVYTFKCYTSMTVFQGKDSLTVLNDPNCKKTFWGNSNDPFIDTLFLTY
jgi:hypothetical protein